MRLASRISRAYTKDELMKSFSKSKLYMQNVVFYGNENAMTIIPIKATYGFKKDYISVTKPGYILIEVIPVEKSPSGEARESTLSWQKKKSFSLNHIKAGGILGLPREFDTSFELELQSVVSDPKLDLEEKKILKFYRSPETTNGMVKIELRCSSKQSASTHKIDIQHSDLVVMQSLINYSLPYIVGWHALADKQAVLDEVEQAGN